MQDKRIRDYLSFTRKERTAIIILVVLIFLIFIFPVFIKPRDIDIDAKATIAYQKEIEDWQSEISKEPDESNVRTNAVDYEPGFHKPTGNFKQSYTVGTLFYFDPNQLDAEGWKKLGLRERTIQTILKYISKGGRFRKPEDIRNIYGLNQEAAERLIPFIRIREKERSEPSYNKPYSDNNSNSGKQFATSEKSRLFSEGRTGTADWQNKANDRITPLDINTADTAAWIALPGIGAKLALRIIHFRNRLGGFHSIEQVKETYGLKDSVFISLKKYLTISSVNLQSIQLNNADASELHKHPYIPWNIANGIIQYRNQHGNFKKVGDIQAIDIITPALFEKLAPYLRVD